MTLKEAMKTLREPCKSGRSVDGSEYSVKIAKLLKEVQWLAGLVESKDLALQTMPI